MRADCCRVARNNSREPLDLGGAALDLFLRRSKFGVVDRPDMEVVQVGEELTHNLFIEPINNDRRARFALPVGAGIDPRRRDVAPLARLTPGCRSAQGSTTASTAGEATQQVGTSRRTTTRSILSLAPKRGGDDRLVRCRVHMKAALHRA